MTERERLPNRRSCELETFDHGGFRYVAGTSRYADGRLSEIFLNVEGRSGAAADIAARESAICASLYFQRGGNLDELRHALLRDTSGAASGPLGAILDRIAGRNDGRMPDTSSQNAKDSLTDPG